MDECKPLCTGTRTWSPCTGTPTPWGHTRASTMRCRYSRSRRRSCRCCPTPRGQGLTLLHFSAQPEPFLTLKISPKRPNNPFNSSQIPPNTPKTPLVPKQRADVDLKGGRVQAPAHGASPRGGSSRWWRSRGVPGRGLHSSTFQLNLSRSPPLPMTPPSVSHRKCSC